MSVCACCFCLSRGVRNEPVENALHTISELYEQRIRERDKTHRDQLAALVDAVMEERRELGRYCLRIEQAAVNLMGEVRDGFAKPVTVRIRHKPESKKRKSKRKART